MPPVWEWGEIGGERLRVWPSSKMQSIFDATDPPRHAEGMPSLVGAPLVRREGAFHAPTLGSVAGGVSKRPSFQSP